MKLKNTISFLLFLCMEIILSAQSYAQNTPVPANEFPIGAFVATRNDDGIYNSFDSTRMNSIVHFVDQTTMPYLINYNVIANNQDYDTSMIHWISYYSTGYYSKWESEESQTHASRIGVKHKYGQAAVWRDTSCWSTLGVNAPVCSLVYGPHYRQAKSYKGWTHGDANPVRYISRFNMALDYDTLIVNPDSNVCIIKVVHRYATIYSSTNWTVKDTIIVQDTLQVKDFNKDGSFKSIELDEYQYDSRFHPGESMEKKINNDQSTGITYSDSNGDNGIQFCVDWLRNDTLCTLYIDYSEVYDNNGWNNYISNSERAKNRIINYAQNYSQWSNIKYWYGHDEPYSLDAYVPMRTVDSILRSATTAHPRLINSFYPYWDLMVNGEPHLATYVNMVNPAQLMIDYYPFSNVYHPIRSEDLESVRAQFQLAHSVQPGFWYNPQSFGIKAVQDSNWCSWRRPDSSELKTTVMLALAHGSKGILFWNFDSYDGTTLCNVPGYFDCILDINGNRTDLWYLIRDNLAPRLKGTLGNSLLKLNYTGNYVSYKNGLLENTSNNYLSLFDPQIDPGINFHAGMLVDTSDYMNKYFLLLNLSPEYDRNCGIEILNLIGYQNVKVLEVEYHSIDTTIASTYTGVVGLSAGEGRLYQVAPVVKYGGELIADEIISSPITLHEEMTIENGATLYINSTYTANANITVKNGGKIIGGANSSIVFTNNHQLIIEGASQVNGTLSNRLILNFSSSDSAGVL